MPTFEWSELPVEAIDPEHSSGRGSVYRGESIEVTRATYPAGSRITAHATSHEAVHSILGGRARFRAGGQEQAVGPGDAILVRANALQSAEILDDLEVVTFRDVEPDPDAGPAAPAAQAFYTWAEMESDLITPKYSASRGPTLLGDRMEVVYMYFPAGTEGKLHSHPNEQLQVVLQGKAIAVIEGREFTLVPGRGILFPATLTHGARILEDYTVLNCKNIVRGWSTYHASYQR
jgi:quercetin dioxygenase-like cupin family protein